MNTKALVIGLSWEQQPLIDRMLQRGWTLYGIHQQGADGTARANELQNCFEQIRLCDLRDLSTISEFAAQVEPEIVVSDQCDYSHFAQTFVAQQQGIAGPTIEAAQISSNKYLQREKCREQNIDIPKFQLCSNHHETVAAANAIGFPVILKPTDNRGSFGVNRVDCETQLQSAFFDALANSHSRTILVEEFIVGTHITIDGYAFPGLGCKSLALATKGLLPGTTNQVAMDIIYPGELSDDLYEKACAVNEQVNQKLGYQFGMTHSEYMITESGRVVLIESANRGGGCFTSQLIVPQVSGIDLIEQLMADVQGIDYCNYQLPQRNPTILKFVSLDIGTISKINGVDELKDHPNVLAARLMVEPGTVIRPVSNDANRHGFIIYSDTDAETPAALRESSERLLDQIEIVYASDQTESLVA